MKWFIPGSLLAVSIYVYWKDLCVPFSVFAGLLLLQASSLIIQIIFRAVERAEKSRTKTKLQWSWKNYFSIARQELIQAFTPTGGTIIGWLERWAIFLTVAFFAEPWMIVGAIVTFKSFGRYPEILAEQNFSRHQNRIRKSAKFVEKFLIGTAISVLIAVTAGMYVRLYVLQGVKLLEFGAITAPQSG